MPNAALLSLSSIARNCKIVLPIIEVLEIRPATLVMMMKGVKFSHFDLQYPETNVPVGSHEHPLKNTPEAFLYEEVHPA